MAFLHCELHSLALRADTSVNVFLPQNALTCSDRMEDLPVLYLLHGRSHNYSVWQRYSHVEELSERYQTAVIMPEVGRSFYTDMEYGQNAFTYITEELPELCQSFFHISSLPGQRYIAGMSMGGYGTLKAGFSCPDSFAACAAFSAVADIQAHVLKEPEESPKKNEYRAIFGLDLKIKPEDDLFSLSRQAVKSSCPPRLLLACGTEDHLYSQNLRLREHLSAASYPMEYREWPGGHDWKFWNESIAQAFAWFFGS